MPEDDGRCQYQVLQTCCYKKKFPKIFPHSNHSTDSLQERIWNHVEQNFQESLATLIEKGKTADETLQYFKKPGTWGCELSLIAFADLEKVNLKVHKANGSNEIFITHYPDTPIKDHRTCNIYLEVGKEDRPLHYFTSLPYSQA